MSRVAMLLHAHYEEDPRVRKEAETLVAAGIEVDVFALRAPGQTAATTIEGVSLTRLPVQRHQGAGIAVYLREYTSFALRAAIALVRAHRRRDYRLVITHSPPDWLIFAALPLRLMGVPLLLDLHEASPEFFRVRFGARSRLARALTGIVALAERASTAIAARVVATTPAMITRLEQIGVPPATLTLVPNVPLRARFAAAPARDYRAGGPLRLLYTGALTPIYELDVAIEAVGLLRAGGIDVRLDIYGRGDARAAIEAHIHSAGLASAVTLHDRVPLEAVPALYADTDIALAPTRRNAFTELTISNKAFEGAAAGRLVVASDLPTLDAFDADDAIARYRAGDATDMAAVIRRLDVDPAERAARRARLAAFATAHDWATSGPRYAALITEVLRPVRSGKRSR